MILPSFLFAFLNLFFASTSLIILLTNLLIFFLSEKSFIQIKVVRKDVIKLIKKAFKNISSFLSPAKSFVKIKGIEGTNKAIIQLITSFKLISFSLLLVIFSICVK
jgi:hypothetical protein